MFKLTTLNLNGIRSATSKGLEAWLKTHKPDALCVQEVKAQAPDMAGKFEALAGMQGYFHFAEKKGYSGTAIFSKSRPISVMEGIGIDAHDKEGRVLTAEYDDFFLVNVYVPNSKDRKSTRLNSSHT